MADHVEHARAVAGVDHIGLGGDYDGTDVLPVGLEDVSATRGCSSELADRGWAAADLEKLTGRNMLRVLPRRSGRRRSRSGPADYSASSILELSWGTKGTSS